MASDSEHTNRPRPPQRAQGRKWPIFVLLLGVVTLTLALTACAGPSSTSTPGATSTATPAPTVTAPPTPSSTSTPGATTGSPPTATSAPASTPTPKPTEATQVGESAGLSRETQEYIEAHCAFLATGSVAATWGDSADHDQKIIDWIEQNKPPEELRDLFEATAAWLQSKIEFAEERRSVPLDNDEAWAQYQSEEGIQETSNSLSRAQQALDYAVVEAFNKC